MSSNQIQHLQRMLIDSEIDNTDNKISNENETEEDNTTDNSNST